MSWLICCLIYKTNYKRKLITYTDVLHAVLIDNAKHAYVVHLNKDAFLGATGLGAYRVHTVQAQELIRLTIISTLKEMRSSQSVTRSISTTTRMSRSDISLTASPQMKT